MRLLAPIALFWVSTAVAQEPRWIWISAEPRDGQECVLRRNFELDGAVADAWLTGAGDNHFVARLNGAEVARGDDWTRPVRVDVTGRLRAGSNLLEIDARNDAGPAAICAVLEVALEAGERVRVVSDDGWEASDDGERWRAAVEFGSVHAAAGPWFDVLAPRRATPTDAIAVPAGFEVELVRSAQIGEGSWVALAFDPRGRVLLSQQYGPILRLTLPDRVEELPAAVELRGAQGMLWAHGGLYVSVNGPAEKQGGLWRLRDTTGDDRLDHAEKLASFGPGGEHGAHAVVLGPDGLLYTVHGNMTSLPEGVSPRSPYRNWAEDVLEPREWDPRGHAVGVRAPAGRILRTDADGRSWEILAGGMRNAYDLAFDAHGNLFTFDSDMEWDRGLPWYRPTRVLQVVAGGEYGWRGGSAKWPAHALDSLGAVVDVGEGSPTGIEFGTRSAFPARYRGALFLGDWTFGRILAVHLEHEGLAFRGAVEEFLSGKPLSVTDLTFGPDGALWFTTGGRRTQAGLYRVSWAAANGPPQPSAVARVPRMLEHVDGDLDALWRDLGSGDRVRRFRARVALERIPTSEWADRALEEVDPLRACAAMLALARAGTASNRATVAISIAGRALAEDLPPLEVARIVSVCLSRGCVIDVGNVVAKWGDPLYPSGDPALDRVLGPLLVRVGAPQLAPRAMALLRAAGSQADAIAHAMVLRGPIDGWTSELRREFFRWIGRAKTWSGGESLRGYVRAIERRALASAPESLRDGLAALARGDEDASLDKQAKRARTYTYTEWTLEDFLPYLDRSDGVRSLENGESAYDLCRRCHVFAGRGGAVGPDLTRVSRRFSRRDLLADVLDPHREVSDQYRNDVITLRSGEVVVGRVVEEHDDVLVVCIDPFAERRVELAASAVMSREPSPYSIMPPGLLSTLTLDDILDLIAYLESEGTR